MVTLTRVPIKLFGDVLLDVVSSLIECQTGHHDGTELRQIDAAVALDGQLIGLRLVAPKLDDQGVAGTNDIVGRHLYVRHRRECAGFPFE